jgi:hypothetical protein
MTRLFCTLLFSLSVSGSLGAATVLVEAERFEQFGGWVHDSQFMDQMGSPFLLAHGLGVPVADATTTVRLPHPGTYRVWVRTRDWVGPWKAAGTPPAMKATGSPGRFHVLVDGKPLAAELGAEGAEWHWQEGGTIETARDEIRLALHDLTGFEGRCDAVVFSNEPGFNPPEEPAALAAFRRERLGLPEKPNDAGSFDLVVVGGGIAGTCAAIAGARLGLKTALIQDRPVLGGNNSSEVRVWLQGARNRPPFPRVGDVVAELEQARHAHYGASNTAELYEDDRKVALARAEKNLALFLLHRLNGVEKDGPRLRAAIAQQTVTGERRRFAGRWYVDATGDGGLGFLAGADREIVPKGRMGSCNLWHAVDTGSPSPFPCCPWALDLSDKPFPGRPKPSPGASRPADDPKRLHDLGCWFWESGFDQDPFQKEEYLRDWNFRAMYGAWDALKNMDKAYPNYKLHWAAHIAGKRESRRLLGDVVLTQDDVVSGRPFPDGCVPTGWPIDLHLPDPRYEKGFEGDAFISRAHYVRLKGTFWIPYRCLYSRNVPNLFMAGRDISVTHEALGTVRVMRTGGCMGEIAGMAASLCKKHDIDPRAIYANRLEDLKALMRIGAGKKSPASAGPRE